MISGKFPFIYFNQSILLPSNEVKRSSDKGNVKQYFECATGILFQIMVLAKKLPVILYWYHIQRSRLDIFNKMSYCKHNINTYR
jgi:hypothetical protein